MHLQERSVAYLQYLSFHMAAHLAGKIQAGICLIHGITFGSRKINKMSAVFEHFCPSRLFSSLIGQGAGVTVAPGATALQRMLVSIRRMATFFGQCVQSAFGGCICSAAERAIAVNGRNIDDHAVIFRQKDFQSLPLYIALARPSWCSSHTSSSHHLSHLSISVLRSRHYL